MIFNNSTSLLHNQRSALLFLKIIVKLINTEVTHFSIKRQFVVFVCVFFRISMSEVKIA